MLHIDMVISEYSEEPDLNKYGTVKTCVKRPVKNRKNKDHNDKR